MKYTKSCGECAGEYSCPSLEYMEKLGFTVRDGRVYGFTDEDGKPVRQKVEG